MDTLLQQIINGLVLGSMYALVALGYTMVYGIINLINFAHGEVMMVGALTSWTIIGLMKESMPGTPGFVILIIALLIACVVAASLNFVIEKVAYRPLRNSPKLAPLITAIGMSILLQTLAMIIWKPNYKSYPTLLPNTPTMREIGAPYGLKDFESVNWWGFYGPKNLPKDIQMKLNQALNKTLKSKDVIDKLATLGAEPGGGTPEAFQELVLKDRAQWSKLIQSQKITLD